MHDGYERYAVYWIPQRGSALAEFGCAWTGWCADGAQRQAPPKPFQSLGEAGSLARQGLHACLAGPFRLRRGFSLWGLQRAVEAVAAATPVLSLGALSPVVVRQGLALGLPETHEGVETLLQRLGQALAAVAYKTEPIGAFRMDLLSRDGTRTVHAASKVLEPYLAPLLRRRQAMTDIALVGETGADRPWRVIERYGLARDAATATSVPQGMDCAGPSLLAPLDMADTAV